MAVSWLARLAEKAPVPVFAAIGEHGLAAADNLALNSRLSFVASPREAGVLLIAGEIDAARHGYLERLHDQLPHPRATVFWQSTPNSRFGNATVVGDDEDAADVVARVHRQLVAGSKTSEPDLLPDEPPNPWRGKGDHGQGGEGMMGGVPYGRPMAMTDDDIRDGLQLDVYSAEFGPFLPMFPPGLVLKLTLQGDVIQTLSVVHSPFAQADEPSPAGALRRAARVMRLIGQPACAERMQRMAMRIAHGGRLETADSARVLPSRWILASIPSDLGEAGDVRMCLASLIELARADERAPKQFDADIPDGAALDRLLIGLEWHEAMLVLASLSVDEITRLGARIRPERESETHDAHDGSHHAHGTHGAHG